MNLLISFLLLIALSSNQVLGLNPAEPITRLKNTVNSETNDLQRYNNNLEFNLKMKLSRLKTDQMQNVNNAVNPALADARKSIEEAKQQGKNAEHCYEPGRQLLGDASKTAFRSLDQCQTDQLNTLKPVQQNIEAHLLRGKMLLSELDSIAISCASGTPMQMQICIAGKMPAANNSVQNYQSVANQLKTTGNSLSSSAEIDAVRCFQQPMSNLYSSVSSARISITTCIRNA